MVLVRACHQQFQNPRYQQMHQEAIDLLIEKNPKLKGARTKLEAMQPGNYCIHGSWGFGRIREYDENENRLIIDFEEGKDGHAMDPAFCIDKLDILPPEHILVRQRQEPDLIAEMIKKRPADLVAEILVRYPDQTCSAIELENLLGRLLGKTKFKKWWTSTKKALMKDPRIATPSRKTDPYVLRDEPLSPEAEILEEFYLNKHPKKKILLAEKLFQLAGNVEEIASDLPNIFETLTRAIKDARQLSQADRLHGVWVRNDLGRHLHEDVEIIEPTSRSLILETENLSALAAELPASYYKRFLDLLTRVYPEDWQNVILNLLRNSSGKFTSECIGFFYERDGADLVASSFRRWLDEQAIKGPVLLWIIKNRNSRKFKKLVEGMISPRLLSAILYAIEHEALQLTSVRRIPLADALSDDRELIPDLLEDANAEVARDLAQRLLMSQGFEELTKKSLLARFIKQFPSIQTLVSGESEQKTEQLIVSKASFDARKAEYEELVQRKIPENKEAIAIAREHGDLSENSEYKMARQDQETLLARKAQLESDLARARVTDFTDAPQDVVGVGCIVNVQQGSTGDSQRYAILGAWDSAPEQNILSYQTPLGQALMGRTVGDVVRTEIDTTAEEWSIQEIGRWLDDQANFPLQGK